MTTKSAKSAQTRLRNAGVTVWVERGRLQLRWRQGAMTPRILEYLRQHRAQLTEALSRKV